MLKSRSLHNRKNRCLDSTGILAEKQKREGKLFSTSLPSLYRKCNADLDYESVTDAPDWIAMLADNLEKNFQGHIFTPPTTVGGPSTTGIAVISGAVYSLSSGRLISPNASPASVQTEAELAFLIVCSISRGLTI